jgi:hypothetical protein
MSKGIVYAIIKDKENKIITKKRNSYFQQDLYEKEFEKLKINKQVVMMKKYPNETNPTHHIFSLNTDDFNSIICVFLFNNSFRYQRQIIP